MPLTHHELCFGCGRANLFGLLVEVESLPGGGVKGRCFIKQDHQGAERGYAHPGILCTALSEAMSLAAKPGARLRRIEFEIADRAAVGAFLELEATAERATASGESGTVATARASYSAG